MNRWDRRYREEGEVEEVTLMGMSPEDDTWFNGSPKASEENRRLAYLRAVREPTRKFLVSRNGFITVLSATAALLFFVFIYYRDVIAIAWLRYKRVPPGLWSRDGALLVGADTPFMIKGFSWYGMEEPAHVPGGMTKTSVEEIFMFVRTHNFNAIRVPLAIDNIRNNGIAHKGIAAFRNPRITGLKYLEVLQYIVETAAMNNVLILLDIHRLQTHEVKSEGLWYSKDVPEDQLVEAWSTLCREFGNEWNVLGADIFNEPWDSVWNSTDKARDWKDASERVGNHIHESCPSWLLFIEGVGERAGSVKTSPFWSENLHAMQERPPHLTLRNKVALSPHVYGPSVYTQDYFKGEDFAKNMPAIWDDHFGQANTVTGLATVVGEWGGFYVKEDKEWQDAFLRYIVDRKIGFFYWCLNPESGDTGGLLANNWRSPETEKLKLLETALSTDVRKHLKHFKYLRNWRT